MSMEGKLNKNKIWKIKEINEQLRKNKITKEEEPKIKQNRQTKWRELTRQAGEEGSEARRKRKEGKVGR